MNTYICYYKTKHIEVRANTSYMAQQLATIEFQKAQRAKVKSFDVTVMLAEKDGQPVVHSTAGL